LEEEFENFISRTLQVVIDSCEEMFACPSCGLVIERISAPNLEQSKLVCRMILQYYF